MDRLSEEKEKFESWNDKLEARNTKLEARVNKYKRKFQTAIENNNVELPPKRPREEEEEARGKQDGEKLESLKVEIVKLKGELEGKTVACNKRGETIKRLLDIIQNQLR